MPPVSLMNDDEKKAYLIQLRREAAHRFKMLWISSLTTIIVTMLLCTVLVVTHNSAQTITLTAVGGLALSNLWPMLKREQNDRIAEYHRSIIEAKVDVAATKALEVADKVSSIEEKTNGNLTKAVHEVGKEIMNAKNSPAPGQEAMPKTKEELEQVMTSFAKRFCDDVVLANLEEKIKIAFEREKQEREMNERNKAENI
jgi:hypothetical protein